MFATIFEKNNKKQWLLGLLLVFCCGLALNNGHITMADPAASDPVLLHCINKVPNARKTCRESGVEQAKNVASHECKKVPVADNKKATCIITKAKGYITTAAKGNPDDSKFKSQLKAAFKTPCKGIDFDDCINTPEDSANKSTTENTSAATGFTKAKNLGDGDVCGNSNDDEKNVHINFNFGCLGPDYDIDVHGALNPVEDIIYSIIRFMSIGVGIVVVISIIIAGIQYTSSEGNPEVTQEAKNRVRFTMFGLMLYIFAYSIMQYLVPGGLFK